jgi:hypothetical protein
MQSPVFSLRERTPAEFAGTWQSCMTTYLFRFPTVVKLNNKWSFIDKDGKEVFLSGLYDYAGLESLNINRNLWNIVVEYEQQCKTTSDDDTLVHTYYKMHVWKKSLPANLQVIEKNGLTN